MELYNLGMAATECLQNYITGSWPLERGPTSFQSGSSERPKRHDALLIVDNTGSMAPYVQQVKDALDEIANLVKGMLICADLWSLGDYSTGGGGQQAVVPLGKRMRADTFQESMKKWMQAGTIMKQKRTRSHSFRLSPNPKEFWSPRYSTQ